MATTHTNLLFHIVFSTKYRKNTILPAIQERLYEYIGGILREQKGILLQIGGMPDHVHVLAKLSPTLAISDVIRVTKTNSSKWCNEAFPTKRKFAWQRGFGAFSVSFSNVSAVQSYIQNQAEHHKRTSFENEYRQLLIRHEIAFDERYLFEEEHVV
jgi:REP element-mobilizing transposase RayT